MVALQTQFFWWFVGFYALHELIELGLDLLNYRYTRRQSEVPEFFRDAVSPVQFEKIRDYTLEKIRFSTVSTVVLMPFFWFLILYNGFNALDYHAAKLGGAGTLQHSVLFCIFVSLYFGVIHLPFRVYSIFVIEEKYGFNRMTLATFVVDLFKTVLLGVLIGVPVLFLVFWFMLATGSAWWLWVWGALTVVQFFLAAVYPSLLAPLFNKFEPLSDLGLCDKITALAQKIGFRMSGVYVMDGSRRSGHSNAYFAGMGRFRRIVLFDTLIKQLTQEELLAVLAHEMGHNVKRHVRNGMILSSIMSLAGFWVLSLLIDWQEFYRAFNVTLPSNHAALVIFGLASGTFTFLLGPVMNLWSRYNEYEADRFAVETTGDPEAMRASLMKLTRDNLNNLAPHPAYSFYHYSHPTTVERVDAIQRGGSVSKESSPLGETHE